MLVFVLDVGLLGVIHVHLLVAAFVVQPVFCGGGQFSDLRIMIGYLLSNSGHVSHFHLLALLIRTDKLELIFVVYDSILDLVYVRLQFVQRRLLCLTFVI
jgi:hypothetical protein